MKLIGLIPFTYPLNQSHDEGSQDEDIRSVFPESILNLKRLDLQELSDLKVTELAVNTFEHKYYLKDTIAAELEAVICLSAETTEEKDMDVLAELLKDVGAKAIFVMEERKYWDNKKLAPVKITIPNEHSKELTFSEKPGVNRISFVSRNPQVSQQKFSELWDRHSEIAKEHHPGICAYIQNVLIESLETLTLNQIEELGGFETETKNLLSGEFDGIAELYFESTDDMDYRMYKDETSKGIVFNDIEKFLDIGAGTRVFTRQYILSSDL